jgi:hypothetical protein
MRMDQPDALSPIEALVLVRLLPAMENGVKTADIRKDLEPLLDGRWSGNALTEVLDRTVIKLVSYQLVFHKSAKSKRARPTVSLTPEGRSAALAFLRVSELPAKPKPSWASLKKALLLAPALGLSGSGATLTKDDNLRAALLARHYDLPLGESPTLKQAKTEWLRQMLGMGPREKVTLDTVQAALFRRESGDAQPLPPKRALDRLLARRLCARRDDTRELRDVILRTWIAGGNGQPATGQSRAETVGVVGLQPAVMLDLETFAQKVRAAARSCSSGRYGDNKVFIAHVWRSLQDDPEFRGTSLDAFKQRLAEANNTRLIDLGRADLVQAMDHDDVQLSEVSYLSATFHFVRTEPPERR